MALYLRCLILTLTLFAHHSCASASYEQQARNFWNKVKVTYNEVVSSLGLEQCNDYNVRAAETASALADNLKSSVHGQPFAQQIVAQRLKNHLQDHDPRKPLVISFYGPTGTGKNYVSQIIADHIYRLGSRSNFVHLFAAQYFAAQKSATELAAELRQHLHAAVKACPRSLIIVDEAHLLPSVTLDSFIPLFKYTTSVEGVDYRKAIFIFLMNGDGHSVFDLTFELEVMKKQSRESLRYREYEEMLKNVMAENARMDSADQSKDARNGGEPLGLAYTRLLYEDYIDLHVPFLPLREQEVGQCAEDELKHRGCFSNYTSEQLKQVRKLVIDEYVFVPTDQPTYSLNGCKRIETMLDVAMASAHRDIPRCARSSSKNERFSSSEL